MSVLIKGMDMPTNCADCKARIAIGCCGNLPYNMRMPNCPLVEVPKHRRLIDAASVEEKARAYVKKYDERSAKNRHPCREVIDYGRFLDMKWSARADGAEAVADMIANAPTVIEGE